jgi:quercetin dioxygenase-like cupin family protein
MAELIKVGAMHLRFLRTKYDTNGALDMFEVMIPPNSRMPVPHHHRDWEETVYGLEGVVTWAVAGKRIEVKPGDDLFIPRGVVHGFVNDTQAIAKMLCVHTPGILGPEFFREMAVATMRGDRTRPDRPEDNRPSTPKQVWNRRDEVRERIVDLALDAPDKDAGSEPTRRASCRTAARDKTRCSC